MGLFLGQYARTQDAEALAEGGKRLREVYEDPARDVLQEAWLKALTVLKQRGKPTPNATTMSELVERYLHHEGLLQRSLEYAVSEALHHLVGEKSCPGKRRILADLTHFRGQGVAPGDKEPAEERDIAEQAGYEERGLAQVEAREELNVLLGALDETDRKAVRAFIEDWEPFDWGYTVPAHVRQRVMRDRKRPGLVEKDIRLAFRRVNTRRKATQRPLRNA